MVACEGAGEDGGAIAERVEIEATSYTYSPATITVPAGRIRFVIHNAADIVHGFEVEGQGMEEEIEEIQPGATDSLTVTLEAPGTYEIYCPVEDHEQRGMIGTLEVEAATP
jgi:plastocyanin